MDGSTDTYRHGNAADDDRRSAPRRPLPRCVQLSRAPEIPLPSAELVDASTTGFLLRVRGRHACAAVHDRLLVSVHLAGRPCHMIGEVRRVDLGHDGYAYIGVQLAVIDEADASLLAEELRQQLPVEISS